MGATNGSAASPPVCGSATVCGAAPCDSTAMDIVDTYDKDGAFRPEMASMSSLPATCCIKAPGASAMRRLPKGATSGPLRRYFLTTYREGIDAEDLRDYTIGRVDTGTYVWTHGESGISVWSEAVNIAAEGTLDDELNLLFHYCSRSAFSHVTNENRKDAELFASILEADGLFGPGVYASALEPMMFGGRMAVLDNTFKTEMEFDRQAGADLHHWVERVAFCIAIIAPSDLCYNVRSRATPEMVHGPGRDAHGGELQPGRDLWVIRAKDEGRCAFNAAAAYEGVLRRRLVRHESSGSRDRAVQDLISLGRHLRRRGRHQESLMAFEKALQINLALHGDRHPSVATAYNEMAVVYHRHCQYAQALEYYDKTLQIQLATLGKAHPHVASTYNNMAVVYGRQGDHSKALEFYEKAHEIKLETLGDKHPSVAATFHNMANIYRRNGEYEQALEFYDKALQIRLTSLGDTHPSVGDTYYNMGMIYRWMKSAGEVIYQDDALKAFKAAYKAYLATYGSDNQETRDAKQQMLQEQAEQRHQRSQNR
mmetsp:Transcript_91973/g.162337  ORF Transcript_91973/g.162337 Transcript_91973/m.162337 type:complete len:539 (+) Transcript_91973:107-1723(+)